MNDTEEIQKFDALGTQWWDTTGPFRSLHHINPTRLEFIQSVAITPLESILDVGCGGGILTEGLAKQFLNSQIMGIDLSPQAIATAQQHLEPTMQKRITYQCIDLASVAEQYPQHFDAITCMELLEHLPDPPGFLRDLVRCLKPGGWIFFATLNRHPKAFFHAIFAAEYLLGLLPKGTHHYAQFIRPSELDRWARACGLFLQDLRGMQYQPWSQTSRFTSDVRVQYLAAYRS